MHHLAAETVRLPPSISADRATGLMQLPFKYTQPWTVLGHQRDLPTASSSVPPALYLWLFACAAGIGSRLTRSRFYNFVWFVLSKRIVLSRTQQSLNAHRPLPSF
jgi:hypothetical protein